MTVTLTTHPSFQQYLVAECAAPSEESARALVEATARRANLEIVPGRYAAPRFYADVHVWLLARKDASRNSQASVAPAN